MKKRKKLLMSVVLMVLVIALSVVPAFAWYSNAAVGYDKVPSKFWGYSVAVGVQSNYKITSGTVASVTNKSNKTANYTKNVSMSKSISLGYSTSSTISNSINISSGAAKNDLGKTIQNTYNFSARFDRSDSDTLSFKVKPKKTVRITGECYGDKVMVYYKYFKFWKTTEMGCATFYVPTWFKFTIK